MNDGQYKLIQKSLKYQNFKNFKNFKNLKISNFKNFKFRKFQKPQIHQKFKIFLVFRKMSRKSPNGIIAEKSFGKFSEKLFFFAENHVGVKTENKMYVGD